MRVIPALVAKGETVRGMKAGRRLRSGRSSLRAATLMVTVLATTATAALAALTLHTVMSSISVEDTRAQAVSVRSQVTDLTDRVQAELYADPLAPYKRVLDFEAPRVCVTTDPQTVVAPGDPWPSSCGSVWGYEPTEDAESVVHLYPPTPESPLLRATVAVRTGAAQSGQTLLFSPGGRYRPFLFDSGNLALADLSQGAMSALSGTAYTPKRMNADGLDSSYTLTDGFLVAEEGFETTVSEDITAFSSRPDVDQNPAVYSSQSVFPDPIPASALTGPVDTLSDLFCPSAGAPPAVVEDRPVYLCLKPGGVLVSVDNTVATLPSDVPAVLVIPGAQAGTIEVLRAPSLPAPLTQCTAACPTPAPANPLQVALWQASSGPNAGGHPGFSDFWKPVATVAMPHSGVVVSKVDTYVGLCGASFTGQPASPCAESEFPGGLTLTVGSSSQPANLTIAGPVSSQGAPIAAVVSGRVVVPHYAHAPGSPLTAEISLLVAGTGAADSAPAVYSWPQDPVTGAGGQFTLAGALLAKNADLDLTQFSSFRMDTTSLAVDSLPPMFPSPSLTWTPLSAHRLVAEQAENAFGPVLPSPALAEPFAPGAVTAVVSDPAELTISWIASTPDITRPLSGYQVHRQVTGESGWELVAETSQLSVVDTGLVAGEDYTYRVRAFGPGGQSSTATGSGTAIAAPVAPSLELTAVTPTSVGVSWESFSSSVAPITEFRALANGEEVAVLDASESSYVFTELVTGREYELAIEAVNAAAATPAAITLSVDVSPLPRSFAGTVAGNQVTLVWQPVEPTLAAPVTGYRVERLNPVSGSYEQVGVTSLTTFTDSISGPGQYTYRVRAYGDLGQGYPSQTTVVVP